MDIVKAQQDMKVKVNVLRIPANERETNIVAVYSILINKDLMGDMDHIPNVIWQIKSIIENINLDDDNDIARSICLIKEKIENSNKNYTNKNIIDFLNAFSKKSDLTFRQIRQELAQSNSEMKKILDTYD
ncbi:hypothetical protein D7217_14065 [Legionella pneumophila]|uniref:hypothetical protein n=1 Tax=Legionella pneumophila TaxID=446 RepID=UPI0004874049|nr:hypothetical protein [Legionella pneumophila]RYW87110.1 hypothetical protein D7217_14065 [Legionella pneumophila]STX99523.1 ankyrin repeat protein [Legionella pneumophila]HAT1776504.1 hypothetical protein [Legionella pneumophila]HAT1779485.1 hypothetical protein [Legionella pneumophila]HAT2019799.1 hypothetical protein [Legionella pneumophila]